MQGEHRVWWFTTARLVAAAVIGLFCGWIFGNTWVGLAAALATYLAWQLIHLFRLDWWVRHRSFADPPEFGGVWGEVVTQVVRLHRRKRYHKQRFVKLVRQIQRSTAALPDGVVILNSQREITWFNRMASDLLNLRGADDYGLRIDNLIRQPSFARYFDGGDYTNSIVLQPDIQVDNYLSMQLVPYGEGQHLLLVRDVSRQMRLENMRKDFVANASHELRSPLSVIAGYLETLAHDPTLDGDLQAPVAEMRRQAGRMTSIITDLLALSKLEESDEAVAGDYIDIPALLAVLRKDVLARASHPKDASGGRTRDSLGVFEPRRQRRQVHPARRGGGNAVVGGPGRWAFCRHGYGYRDSGRAYSAAHRAVLSRRCRPLACDRRIGTWACDREARAAAAWSHARGRERYREWEHVHRSLSAYARL
jgi:two-component system, OmpR family, phosphate regulon sensor histidine kinase PhoR